MQAIAINKFPLNSLPSPFFLVDEVAIENNLKILNDIQQASGAKILHALKAFSMFALADLSTEYLSGTCSSGLHEALLAKQYYGGENHVFCTAYTEKDLIELLGFADHIVFNSCSQLIRFSALCQAALQKRPTLKFGLRINPQHSEGHTALYDPCSAGSRLGITLESLEEALQKPEFVKAYQLISGLHFHSLCEQNFAPLQRTLQAVEKQFGFLLEKLQWLNLGGGHHITRDDYQRDELIMAIKDLKQKYPLDIYLEPGEAIALNSGYLVSEVLDITFNQLPQAILDISATCHMPDILEMPYRPNIEMADEANIKPHTYRLGGLTCLAGDIIGDYSFDEALTIGQKIVFDDMAHYTMVKTSTFNGTKLPSLVIWNSQTKQLKHQKEFSYSDFRDRLS